MKSVAALMSRSILVCQDTMETHNIFFGLLLCALLCALVEAHTTKVCYKLDPCTGEYEAAYGTYHAISQFPSGCPSNPSGRCPSGFSIIDGNSVPFDSLILDLNELPDESGWSESDCITCPGNWNVAVWQKATGAPRPSCP